MSDDTPTPALGISPPKVERPAIRMLRQALEGQVKILEDARIELRKITEEIELWQGREGAIREEVAGLMRAVSSLEADLNLLLGSPQ